MSANRLDNQASVGMVIGMHTWQVESTCVKDDALGPTQTTAFLV